MALNKKQCNPQLWVEETWSPKPEMDLGTLTLSLIFETNSTFVKKKI